MGIKKIKLGLVVSAMLLCVNINSQDITNRYFGDVEPTWAVTNTLDGSLMDKNGNYIIKPWRISLSAKISSGIVTNWTTNSVQLPDSPKPVDGRFTLEYRATGYHESGIIVSNVTAIIEWNGKQVPVVLESIKISETNRVSWK